MHELHYNEAAGTDSVLFHCLGHWRSIPDDNPSPSPDYLNPHYPGLQVRIGPTAVEQR